jgi:ABC-type anion transport system duplicated permease subunit
MVEEKIRAHFGDYLAHAEVAIYSVLAVLLFITALATIANAGKMLWDGLGHWTIAAETLRVLDQLLVVLMLVEILHTVRISIRSHFLVTEPFLVVGLIASIRRILGYYPGSREPHKSWVVFCRECEHISSQHD